MSINQILEQENHEVQTEIFEDSFIISSERNLYNAIRKKYKLIAQQAMKNFYDINNNFQNIHDVIENSYSAFIASVDDCVIEVIQDCISMDVFTIDKEKVIERATKSCFCEFESAFQAILDRYDSIMEKLYGERYSREMRKDSRGRWQSATIDGTAISAWGNQAKSAGMNLVEGAAHSVINMIGNAVSESEAKTSLVNLFNRNELKQNIVLSVYDSCFNLHLLLIKLLKEERKVNIAGTVRNEDAEKATAMFNNYITLPLDKEKQSIFLNQILQLNPYDESFYRGIIEKRGDEDGSLQRFCEHFSVDINSIKMDMLREFVVANLGESEEDAFNCRKLLNEKSSLISYKGDINLVDVIIQERLDKIDLEYRTVDEIELETREIADIARTELPQIQEIISSVKQVSSFPVLSEEREMLSKRDQIDSFSTEVKAKYLKKADERLAEFDKKFKSYGLFKSAPTREVAADERSYRHIKSMPLKSLDDIANARKKLEEILPELGITSEQAKLANNYLSTMEEKISSGNTGFSLGGFFRKPKI